MAAALVLLGVTVGCGGVGDLLDQDPRNPYAGSLNHFAGQEVYIYFTKSYADMAYAPVVRCRALAQEGESLVVDSLRLKHRRDLAMELVDLIVTGRMQSAGPGLYRIRRTAIHHIWNPRDLDLHAELEAAALADLCQSVFVRGEKS